MPERLEMPNDRVRRLNDGAVRSEGRFVLYWMNAARRARWNFALDRAITYASELKRPLIVLETLGLEYPYASERLHAFVLQGMAANAAAFAKTDALYYPYVEPSPGAGKGLIATLGEQACVVITDDFPALFYPSMLASAGRQVRVCMEAVDSNGILPMRASGKAWARAFDFRRFLQRELRPYLKSMPREKPFQGVAIPRWGAVHEIEGALLSDNAKSRGPLTRTSEGDVTFEAEETTPASGSQSAAPHAAGSLGIESRWPAATLDMLMVSRDWLSSLPLDHQVKPVDVEGGSTAARHALLKFVRGGLERYNDDRNQPDLGATSGLSPYLHFGHIAPHEIVVEIARHEGWSPDDLGDIRSGAREGFWNMSPSAEAFMDQIVTWRELGLNFATYRDDLDQFDSLPSWALQSMQEHERDTRPYLYSLEEFEAAQTHEPLWNAAQRELVETGRMHNYMRMLWGKKILHWSASPREAAAIMLHLNDRYALDGRDPNSYSGIFWVLGRYDRAWGPEREVFGKIRFMSCANTHRKLKLKQYLARWTGL